MTLMASLLDDNYLFLSIMIGLFFFFNLPLCFLVSLTLHFVIQCMPSFPNGSSKLALQGLVVGQLLMILGLTIISI
jgi:hypothetical protein